MNRYDEVLTINEACEFLRISRPTLLRLLKNGSIRGFRIGKRVWRIRRSELEEYIEKYDTRQL
jgi:excisionase family DNA binding protein